MPLTVNPKGHCAGDASDSRPKSRVWHQYSDKMIEAQAVRDSRRFEYKSDCAAFDRQRKRLRDMKAKGRVWYV